MSATFNWVKRCIIDQKPFKLPRKGPAAASTGCASSAVEDSKVQPRVAGVADIGESAH